MSEPLVSICVIAYNSSEFINDALCSVAEQDYQNLELIISDDNSNDDTLDICEKWLKKNCDRFQNVLIIRNNTNTGPTGNYKRAFSNTQGKYLMALDGDDMLEPHCVSTYVKYMEEHDECNLVFARCKLFRKEEGKIILLGSQPSVSDEIIFSESVEKQLLSMYRKNFVPSPTGFYRASLFDTFQYDEQYPAFEDYPLFITLLENGVRLTMIDDFTMLYRRGESLSCSSKTFGSEFFHHSYKKFYYNHMSDMLMKIDPVLLEKKRAELFLSEFKIFVLKNKRNIFTRLLGKVFEIIFLSRFYKNTNTL